MDNLILKLYGNKNLILKLNEKKKINYILLKNKFTV